MKLTEKEEKIARLALDKAAKEGEQASAANKLIESLKARGVTVEDLMKEAEIRTEYVYPDPEPEPEPEPHYGNTGYQSNDYYETSEEAAARAKAQAEWDEKLRKEWEREQREERERARAEGERDRAKKAEFDALPGYRKLARRLGALLGPYSRGSFYAIAEGPVNLTVEEEKFRNKVNEIFGLILLGLVGIGLALIPIAFVCTYPIPSLLILLVIVLGVMAYLRSKLGS